MKTKKGSRVVSGVSYKVWGDGTYAVSVGDILRIFDSKSSLKRYLRATTSVGKY